MARSSASFAGSSAARHVRRRGPASQHGTAGRGEQLALPGSGLSPVTDRREARRPPRRLRACQGPAATVAGLAPSRPSTDPGEAGSALARPAPAPRVVVAPSWPREALPPAVAAGADAPDVRESPVPFLSELVSSVRSGVATFRREVRLADLAAGLVALGAFGLWALVLGLLAG